MKLLFTVILSLSIFTINAQQLSFGKTKEGNLMYNNAKESQRRGDNKTALEFYRDAVAAEPTNFLFYRDYANMFIIDGQISKALYILDKAKELQEAEPALYQLAYYAFIKGNDEKRALSFFDDGLLQFPTSPLVHHYAAKMYYAFKKDNNAIELLNKTISIDASYADAYLDLATLLDTQIYYLPKVMLLYETYLQMDPFGEGSSNAKKQLFNLYKKYFKQYIAGKNANIVKPKSINIDLSTTEIIFLKALKSNRYMLINGFLENDFIDFRRSVIESLELQYDANDLTFALYQLHALNKINLLETYNRWIFGQQFNLDGFEDWAAEHIDELERLKYYLKNNQQNIDKK